MTVPSGGSLLLDADKILKQLEIADGMQLGELGCGGRGHFVFPAQRMVGPTGFVYAIDVVPAVLNAITRQCHHANLLNVSCVWSDIEVFGAAKVPALSLDRATLINVLFQCKDRAMVFQEAKRLLKLDGRLLIVDWKSENTPFGPPTSKRVSPSQAISLAEQAGFRVEKQFEAGPHHYGIIFRLR